MDQATSIEHPAHAVSTDDRPSSSASLSLAEFRQFVDIDPGSIVEQPSSALEDDKPLEPPTLPIHVRTSIAVTEQQRILGSQAQLRDTIRQVTNSSDGSGGDSCSNWSNESRVPSRGAAALGGTENEVACQASPNLLKKDSSRSLSSLGSSGTVIVKKVSGPKKRASYSAFPKSSKSLRSQMLASSSPLSEIVRSASYRSTPGTPPRHVCRSTPSSSDSSGSRQNNRDSPNFSGSWADHRAESVQPLPRISARTMERWNPRVSVIHSSGSQSTASGDQTSRTVWTSSSSGSKGSFTALSPSVDLDYPPIPLVEDLQEQHTPSKEDEGVFGDAQIRQPVFKPAPVTTKSRNVSTSTIRVVPDLTDTLEDTPVPILRSLESAVQPSRELIESACADSPSGAPKAGTRASLFHDGIPAWAKAYYGRPKSISSVPKASSIKRTSTSTDNISLRIFRLGSRVHGHKRSTSLSLCRKSGLRMHPVRTQSLTFIPPRPKTTLPWSPHLWHERSSLGKRQSVFKAPGAPRPKEGHQLTRRGLQVMLFTLGFACPPLWLVAASLPVPAQHKGRGKDADDSNDPEKAESITDEIWSQNARWWRHINRIMCLVGFVVIAAVVGSFNPSWTQANNEIALVVVACRRR